MPTSDSGSPYERALAVAPDTFAYDLDCHLRHGIVISTPEYFLLARSVDLSWSPEQMREPSLVAPEGACWWIWATAGNWRKATLHGLSLYGWKDWLGFDRNGRMRLVETGRLV